MLYNKSIQEMNFNTVELLYDVLIADLYNGRPLPMGMTNELWRNITQLDSLNWWWQYGNDLSVSKLMNSNLLNAIV